MGTPDFAVPCLQALLQQAYEVVGVFTQPDKPKGRGYKMIPPPVKAAAVEAGLSVYQPLSLRKGRRSRTGDADLAEIKPRCHCGGCRRADSAESRLWICQSTAVSIFTVRCLLPAYRGAGTDADVSIERGKQKPESPPCRWQRAWIQARRR